MNIRLIEHDKKQFLPLLLLADEQESMIDRYLNRGKLYALFDHDLRAVAVVTDEGDHCCEIKNIAVAPQYQRMGYGRVLIESICDSYKNRFDTILVGTGDSPLTVPFYKSCGFVESHRVPNFFVDHYDHPIFEAGVQLRDMLYFKKKL